MSEWTKRRKGHVKEVDFLLGFKGDQVVGGWLAGLAAAAANPKSLVSLKESRELSGVKGLFQTPEPCSCGCGGLGDRTQSR